MTKLYEATFTSDIDPTQLDPYVVVLQVRYNDENFKQRMVNICNEKVIIIQYSKVDPILQVVIQRLFKEPYTAVYVEPMPPREVIHQMTAMRSIIPFQPEEEMMFRFKSEGKAQDFIAACSKKVNQFLSGQERIYLKLIDEREAILTQ